MKKWWLWIIGTVVLLSVGFVAIALLMPPSGQFGFLDGQKPVPIAMPARDREQMEKMGIVFTVYSFQGQFDSVKARAQKELVADGYMDMGGMMVDPKSKAKQASFVKGNIFAGMTSGSSTPNMPEVNMVMIMSDTRITQDTPFVGTFDPTGKAKGWVSVVVMGKPSTTIFDRFRGWIGL